MRSYYSFDGQKGFHACSLESGEYPLTVNCAGNMKTAFSFTTDNPRGREDYYLLYTVHGEMTLTLQGIDRVMREGSLMLLPPRTAYRYTYGVGEPLSYFWVHFTGSYAARFLEECQLSPLPFLFDVGGKSLVAERFHALLERTESPKPFLKQELSCALERLILCIAQEVHLPERDGALERSMRLIHASYQTDLRIPELARMENLSHSRYIAVFREQNGVSPTAYIIGLRVRNACELLRSTDMTVKQIAAQVGYDDPFFFSKLFKRHTGASPSEYRRR